MPYGYGARLVEQLAFNQLDAGSTPVVPTIIRINLFANKEPRRRLPGARTRLHARLIQLIECHSYKVEVAGLSPAPSTICGYSLKVKFLLAMETLRVRFSLSAPFATVV